MATVKRTFTMPEEVSSTLDNSIPDQERSAFVSKTLAEALRSRQREMLIDAIDNFETWQPKAQSVVEAIRELRQEQSQNLAT